MKMFRALTKATFLAITLAIVAGCSTPNRGNQMVRHFHDARRANVVLRFSSWEYTFMVKPFYAENGFMEQVRRENIDQVFDRMSVHRGMAVVVVGWQYNSEQLKRLVTDWKSILGNCGFQRVVILRASIGGELNGSIIIDDSDSFGGTAQRTS